jgi:hypothetical protein
MVYAMRKVIIEHALYGCEHPCCGTAINAIETVDGEEYERKHEFRFEHIELRDAKEFAENHVKKYWPDWVGVPIEIGDLRCSAS